MGSAVIQATFSNVIGNTNLYVVAASVSSITIDPDNATIAMGASQQFTATAHYTDSTLTTDVTVLSSWSDNNTGVATIYQGLAAGRTAGVVQITAIYSGQTAHATLMVHGATASETSH